MVTVTEQWYVILRNHNIFPETKFENFTQKNVGDMQILETRSEVKVSVPSMVCYTSSS